MDQLKAGIHGDIQAMVRSAENKFARMGVMGGAGTGSTSKAKVVKGFAVRDLSEKADASEFRRWQRTVELPLLARYGMTNFDLIVEKIRHLKTPINEESLQLILAAIHQEKPHAISLSNWDFQEKSRWLYHYLIMKLSTRLFNATTHVRS